MSGNINTLEELCIIIKKCSGMDDHQILVEKNNISGKLSVINLADISLFFNSLNNDDNIATVFKMFRLYLEFKMFDEKDLGELINICNKCLILSDEFYPIIINEDAYVNTDQINFEKNMYIAELSLVMFMDFFCFAAGYNCWNRNIKLKEGNNFQKSILKKLGGKFLIAVTSRLGNYKWSNNILKNISKDILEAVCRISNCHNVSSLIAGSENPLVAWFPEGLFPKLLTELTPRLYHNGWKKVPYLKHVLVWCITKIKFPLLVSHISSILPFLLQLVDDYETENKCLGISTIEYLISNVTPSDLCLHNHADVIYDALFKQLYMNEDQVYEVTLSCVLKVLLVLYPKYNLEIKYTKWDDTLEKILENIEYTNKFSTKKILLNYLPKFFNHMDISLVKHTDRILSIIALTLELSDGEDEFCRNCALKILNETLTQCSPVIFRYEDQILKFLMKFLIDLLLSEHLLCSSETKTKLFHELANSIKQMKLSGGDRFEMKLRSIISASVNEKFNCVQNFLKLALEE
ncbi:TELO2-interacting protein 2-like isoform X2 [Hydra vulgaris]|uniref:TELO2-interacting protein 2-like isoform X2 n=1 Tax=Hydra vulgaris TaxID=6087 RepID=A0ABM4D2P7_HYDVU